MATRAPSELMNGMGWMGGVGWDWDLCVGLFYEHRFAMLIRTISFSYDIVDG